MKSKVLVGFSLITFFSPILGLFLGIKNLGWQNRKWLIIMFITMYGSTIILPEPVDGYRHQERVFTLYLDMGPQQFFDELWHIIMFDPLPGGGSDVYNHLLSYITGGVLGIPKFYFVFVSFIFGYFYVSGLSKILRWEKGRQKSVIFFAFVLLLIIYRGIDSLQTVRTWTGTWVLFNGVFGFFQTGNKKYLLLMLAAPLIHAAYFVMALPAFVVIFIKRLTPKFFIIVYVLSFFASVNHGPIIDLLSRTELGETKVRHYYREYDDREFGGKATSEVRWYATHGRGKAFIIGSQALAFAIVLGGYYRKRMNTLEAGLFSTGLMLASFANLGDFIPEFYNRTMANAGLYILASTVLLLVRGELLKPGGISLNLRKAMLWIPVLIWVPKIVYSIASYIQFSSIYLIFGPFIVWFSPESNASIREAIGWFL